jgi:hypothetical protein
MTAVLLLLLLVILAAAAGAFVVMRRHGYPRRAVGAASSRHIDPFTLNDPWRRFVQDAQRARTRFAEAVERAAPGPLRDRLEEIGRSLDEGVQRTWATAQKGQSLRDARRRIETHRVEARLEAMGPTAEDPTAEDPTAARTRESLRNQLESARRLDEVTAGAESQLRLLQAQLDESVARAAELSVRAGDIGALAGVEDDIAHVSDSLEALRLALEETDRGGGISLEGQ